MPLVIIVLFLQSLRPACFWQTFAGHYGSRLSPVKGKAGKGRSQSCRLDRSFRSDPARLGPKLNILAGRHGLLTVWRCPPWRNAVSLRVVAL